MSSISRHVGGLRVQLEPPLNVSLKAELGAERALGVDISNACAGMMTGVFILNDLIRQGRIRRGMVVSAEYISELGRNAAQEVRTVMDDQLASRTLGDAGAAVILEQAPQGAAGIEVAGFTTLSEHSRLCVAFPAKIGPGVTMHTQAREIHRVATEEAVPMLQEVLDQAGLKFDEIDYLIPHQTSARAIQKATEAFYDPFYLANDIQAAANRGNVTNTTWTNAQHAGWNDEQLAEAFAHVGLTLFTVYFLNYAQTDIDVSCRDHAANVGRAARARS